MNIHEYAKLVGKKYMGVTNEWPPKKEKENTMAKQLEPLHRIIQRQDMQVIEAAWSEHANLLAEFSEYKARTNNLLKDIQEGKVQPNEYIVSDDGFEMKPKKPTPTPVK